MTESRARDIIEVVIIYLCLHLLMLFSDLTFDIETFDDITLLSHLIVSSYCLNMITHNKVFYDPSIYVHNKVFYCHVVLVLKNNIDGKSTY